MKLVLMSVLVAVGLIAAGGARASAELAEKNCGKCHEMDKKKKGASYKSIAAKFKGDEAAALKAIEDPKGDHPEVKVKPEDLKAVVKWVMQQK